MIYEWIDFFLKISWLSALAAVLTLLSKPKGARFFLLVVGLICMAMLELNYANSDFDSGYYDNPVWVFSLIVGNCTWLLAGLLSLFYLKSHFSGTVSKDTGSIKEALSVIPVTVDNPAEALNSARRALYLEVETILAQLKLPDSTNIQLLQSQNYSAVTFVSLSMFLPAFPDGALANKLGTQSLVLIRLDAHPFMRFPITYSIRVESSYKLQEFSDVYQISLEQLSRLITQLLQGERWHFKAKRLKQAPIQVWRPANNPRDYKQWRGVDIVMMVIPPLLIFPLLRRIFFGKAKRLKLTTGKPSIEPRQLLQLDSWQVAIKGLQAYAEQLETEFVNAMQANTSQFGKLNEELIWYWDVDGKVERKQYVFSIGRALVFIKIYAYGDDLYIGWDAHVNAGSWAEKNIGAGYAHHDGTRLDVYSIESEWHQPNEFDISDANFALETVHATLVKLTKRLIKERDVDQDIDFTIVRESRSGVLNSQQKPASNEKKKRFMRTG